MGLDAVTSGFQMLSFKPTLSLSSLIFIKRLFSSSFISAIRVVSLAYLRIYIFYMYIHIYVCMHMHICICIYTHIIYVHLYNICTFLYQRIYIYCISEHTHIFHIGLF